MAQQLEEEKRKEVYEAISKEKTDSIRKKLVYIQKLNEERTKMQEDTFEAEYLELKKKYELEYANIYNQISEISKGTVYPSISEEEQKKYEIGKHDSTAEAGIPEYWLTALQNASNFVDINENDEKILKHLTDIKIVNKDDKLSYTIEFHFTANEWFSDAVLSKTYLYDIKDHQLHAVERSGVNWKSADKVPNKIIKTKTIKKGKKTETKTTEKIVESFFDMFVANKEEEDVKDSQEEGEFFKDDLIPFSMEYYLKIIDTDMFGGCDDEECEQDH